MEMLENDNIGDNSHLLNGVRCAAHSLQLAVEDALKKTNVSATINNARTLAIKLRTPNMQILIKDLNINMPPLDCPTRFEN